jgi:hypothetical protein
MQQENEERQMQEGAYPEALNRKAFDDLTDLQNEDFLYAL